MRVEISDEQRALIKDETRVPHAGAAKQRQHQTGEQRFDEKQEKGAEKGRE